MVRLHTGEPSIYGAIGEQMDALDRLGIAYEVVPGISSFQAAAAALRVELTAPEIAQTVILTRAPGRTPMPPSEDLGRLAETRATLCIFLSTDRLGEITGTLARHYGEDCPAAVVYHASWPDERVLRGTLADIAEQARAEGLTRTAIFLVGRALGRRCRACRSSTTRPSATATARETNGEDRAGEPEQRGGAGGGAACRLPARGRGLPACERRGVARGAAIRPHRRPHAGAFCHVRGFIYIAPTGLVVRALAPCLEHKTTDPAVVVVDVGGRWAVSLLSGHEGGANDLALAVANAIGAEPVITTTTEAVKDLIVGVGCRRGTPAESIIAAVREALAAAGGELARVRLLASADIKADEPGLRERPGSLPAAAPGGVRRDPRRPPGV